MHLPRDAVPSLAAARGRGATALIDHRIAILVLAAGASRRMRGRDKLLEDIGGKPLLRSVADTAWASAASEVVTVLGARAEARQDVLGALPLRFVQNANWQSGMASSIRAGIDALPETTDGAIILLADMPDIRADLLNDLITAFDPERGITIVRPVSASGPVGNPILFGRRHFPALASLTGDTGAKPVIAANPDAVLDLPTGDDGVLTDLDTPEAWAAWRKTHEPEQG